jgi:Uncharacterized protein conserved in bacteria (DUF2188)
MDRVFKRRKEVAMTRRQYFVVLHEGKWKITFEGQRYGPYRTQEEAIDIAREWARQSAAQGHPSQVLVQGRDGQFRVEWTYGDDPYPPRG